MKFFRPLRPLVYGWLAAFLGWGLVSLTLGINFVGGTDIPWTEALRAGIRDQLPWAILTPLLVRFANRQLIDGSTWKRNLPLHLLAGIVIIWGFHQWKLMIDPGPGPHRRPAPISRRDIERPGPPLSPPPAAWDFFHFVSVEIPIYVMIITGAHALRFYRRAERRTGQLARARLNALQTQLHPHFLFNTLNTIAGLVHKQPDKAESVVHMLSDLLRYSLKANPEAEISLLREIEFVEKYLAIMHVRFEDRIGYELQVAPNTLAASVPTLVLQPIVENAIKHGLEPKPEGGKIAIRAWCDSEVLYLKVSDTGVGLKDPAAIQEGVGLTTTRERLREFYGNAASLKIQGQGGTTVSITLPFRLLK
jgi:two-component system, LytTR family, sensor kinase